MEEGNATLNKDLLLRAVGGQRLNEVKVLTLAGWKLTHCLKLIAQEIGESLLVLNLKGNSLRDIEYLGRLGSLRKIDCCSNSLTGLGDEAIWREMHSLQVLYLHDNYMDGLGSTSVLKPLSGLLHLTLFNNPVTKLESYHASTIRQFPSLLALDFLIVTNEERKGLMKSSTSKIWLQETTSLEVFDSHLYNMRRKWERASPSIRIQAYWRGKQSRKKYGGFFNERDRAAVKIQSHVRGFLLRRKLQRDLDELLVSLNKDYLMYTPEEYAQYIAVQKIESFVLENFINAKREFSNKTHAATVIQAAWRRYKASMKALPLYVGKLFFLKAQQRAFVSLLKVLCSDFSEFHPLRKAVDESLIGILGKLKPAKLDLSFKALAECISPCSYIKVVRFPELDTLKFSPLPIQWYSAWAKSSILVDYSYKQPFTSASLLPKYRRYPEYKAPLAKLKSRTRNITGMKARFTSDQEFFDLLEFRCPSVEVNEAISRLALKLNKVLLEDTDTSFVLLHEPVVKRVTATIALQSLWRAHSCHTNPPLIQKLTLSRAVTSVQRWWRDIIFLRRMTLLTRLKFYLAELTESSCYMQEHLFQALSFSEDSLKIPEQGLSFYTIGTECFQVPSEDYDRPMLPKWVGLELNQHSGLVPDIEKEQVTLQAAVLTGAQISVQKLYRIVERKSYITDSNLKFLKLEYRSPEELRRRAALLFLLTFDNSTNSFVSVFSRSQLSQEFLISKLRLIWGARQIDPSKPCISTMLIEEALQPAPEVAVNKDPEEVEEPVEDITELANEIVRHQERAVSEVTNADVTNWRVRVARQQVQQRQLEASLNKSVLVSYRQTKGRIDKDKLVEDRLKKDRQDYASKKLVHRLRIRQVAKQARKNKEREFVKQFAQAKNMIEKQLVQSDLRKLRSNSIAANVSHVKRLKEHWESYRSQRMTAQEVRRVDLGSDFSSAL
jgi:hypothetical protein